MSGPTRQELREEVYLRVADRSGTTFESDDINRLLNRGAQDVALKVGITRSDIGFLHTKGVPAIPLEDQILRVEHLSFRNLFQIKPLGNNRMFSNPWRGSGVHQSYPVAFSVIGRELWLYPSLGQDLVKTTINQPGGMGITDSQVTLTNVSGFPLVGKVKIDDEWIHYYDLDVASKTLKNLRRGIGGTKAASHTDGTEVALADIHGIILRKPKTMDQEADTLELGDQYAEAVVLYAASKALLSEGRVREGSALWSLYKAELEKLGGLDENLDGMDTLLESDWPGSWPTIPNV